MAFADLLEWNAPLAAEAHQAAQNYYSQPSSGDHIALFKTLQQIRGILRTQQPPYEALADYLLSVLRRARTSPTELSRLSPPTETTLTVLREVLLEATNQNPEARTAIVAKLAAFVTESQNALDQPLTVEAVRIIALNVNSLDRSPLRALSRLLNTDQNSATWSFLAQHMGNSLFFDGMIERSQHDSRIFEMGTDPLPPQDVFAVINDTLHFLQAHEKIQRWREGSGLLDDALRRKVGGAVIGLTRITSTGIQSRALRLLREVVSLHLQAEPARRFLTDEHVAFIRAMDIDLDNRQTAAIHREIVLMLAGAEQTFPIYDAAVAHAQSSIQYFENQTVDPSQVLPVTLEEAYLMDLIDNLPSQLPESEQVRALKAILEFFEVTAERHPERLGAGGDLYEALTRFVSKVSLDARPGSDLLNRLTLIMVEADVDYCELNMLPSAPRG